MIIDIPVVLKPFINLESVITIIGGLLISSSVFLSFEDAKNLFRLIRKAITRKVSNDKPQIIIDQLIELAKDAHIAGKRHMRLDNKGITNPFILRGAGLIIDHFGEEYINNTLANDIMEMRRRHSINIDYFNTMGALSPMFGLLGTVIGIILLLRNINDVARIGESMSLAMNNTLYGIMFAALFFLPVAKKLENLSEHEAQIKELIMDGILMIEKNETPSKIEKYLHGYLKSGHKKSDEKQ